MQYLYKVLGSVTSTTKKRRVKEEEIKERTGKGRERKEEKYIFYICCGWMN
jgi:hypothetical protein